MPQSFSINESLGRFFDSLYMLCYPPYLFPLFTFVYSFRAKPLYSHHTATLLFLLLFPFPFIVFPFMVNDVQLSIFLSSFQDSYPSFLSITIFPFSSFCFTYIVFCYIVSDSWCIISLFLVLSFVMIFFFPLPYTCFARTFVVHVVHLL